MIITCPNCKKKFKIDPSLIPTEGRDLQCGSCKHIWFYKIEDQNLTTLTLDEKFTHKEVESNLIEDETKITTEDKKSIPVKRSLEVEKKTKQFINADKTEITHKKRNTSSKFISYLIVFILSFVVLIILLDTLKTPLIGIFPGIEVILFNLFETLKDIKLFIIDLS